MLMEAVMESLKDFKMKNAQEDNQASSVGTDTKDVLQKEECGVLRIDQCGVLHPEASSTANDQFSQFKVESASTSEEYSMPIKPESTSAAGEPNSVSDLSCSDKSKSSVGPASYALPSTSGTENAGASSCSNTPANGQNSAEADLSANTKATVTVVRNPASHIMDGLIRRWDLNFFKNNQNR